MLGIIIFVCLCMGPRAKWVKRFLPGTANRVVFVIIVTAMIVAWVIQGVGGVDHGGRGVAYFTLIFAVLFCAGLWRFIYEWWIRSQSQATQP